MKNIVLELTNRCNLNCQHCLDARHRADGDLEIEFLSKILDGAGVSGFNHISLTGGEPTLHPGFTEIIRSVSEAGYNFGLVTNGWNFTSIYENVLPYLERLTAVTFSLDGAREETHDRIRKNGSFRRLMQAVSICVVKNIPFTINTVITSRNRHELDEMADLAVALRSRGLRFGHLLPTPLTQEEKLGLSQQERRKVEAVIRKLRKKNSRLPISLAPGYYTTNLFPCAPLQMEEINIDWRGNLTACCHLSGHGEALKNKDIVINLNETDFSEAFKVFVKSIKNFHYEKIEHHSAGKFRKSDYLPCWYCLNYFKKLDWFKKFPEIPWSNRVWTAKHKEDSNR
jgi:MoaA/NifB/PqqE/SkfB family radical SAM enzyme